MDYYINFKKAATYLEDRDGVRRVKNLYCYVRRFATVYDSELLAEPDGEVLDDSSVSDKKLWREEVYVSGFCSISDDYAHDFFGIVDDSDDIESDPTVKVIQGKVNGQPVKISDPRQFVLEGRIYKNEVYVKQSELDEVSQFFGIPKSRVFKSEHLLTIEQIEKRYDPSDYIIFYPDEEEEFMAFYNISEDASDSDKVHGNTLHNAVYREQVLGAALAIMACDPDAGRTATGKMKATKLREAIDKHANRFWSNNTPPLAAATMEDLFRTWLRYVPQSDEQLNNAPTTSAPFPGKPDVTD